MVAALKSLSDNYNSSNIFVLASIDCLLLFSLKSSCFLVWCVSFDWNLDIWGINVMRVWILFKPSALAGFSDTAVARGGRDVASLLPGGDRSSGSTLSLHWHLREGFLITSGLAWAFKLLTRFPLIPLQQYLITAPHVTSTDITSRRQAHDCWWVVKILTVY